MESKKYINLLLIAAMATTSSCGNGNSGLKPVDQFNNPTPKSNPLPTTTPLIEREKDALNIESMPSQRKIERFSIGEIDLKTQPFELTIPANLMEKLGYFHPSDKKYTADFPLPVLTPLFLGTDEQFKIFEAASKDNSNGNPYYVITSSEANHTFLYLHSYQDDSPGEFARILGGFVYKNPDQISSIIGQNLTLNFGGKEITAQIAFIETISQDLFMDASSNGPWGAYPGDNSELFARTDRLGIPGWITQDLTPGVYYLTIVSCQNKNPGEISFDPLHFDARHRGEDYLENTANRSLITLRIYLP